MHCSICMVNLEGGVELRGYQPYYVKVEAAPAPCMALNGQSRTPATVCPRWAKWEKV